MPRFVTHRFIYIVLLVALLFAVALRASTNKVKETFIDNMYIASLSPAVKFFERDNNISVDANAVADAKDTWKQCNIFTCKNRNAQNDYDNWLDLQRKKLAEYKQERNKMVQKVVKKQVEKQECPSRITQDEWEEPVLTEEETEVLDRLDEVEGQIAEAELQLKQLNQDIKDQQHEFSNNAAEMQQMMNEMENSSKQQKDMNFYETAVDTQVKPWQGLIEETKKKVDGHDKAFNDLSKQIGDLTNRVNLIPIPAPKKKKKKK
jgi:chromosome segregation ATPase